MKVLTLLFFQYRSNLAWEIPLNLKLITQQDFEALIGMKALLQISPFIKEWNLVLFLNHF